MIATWYQFKDEDALPGERQQHRVRETALLAISIVLLFEKPKFINFNSNLIKYKCGMNEMILIIKSDG